MHYHCEIIMPKTDNINRDVTQIMAPFNMHGDIKHRAYNHCFWDSWVIGGRWAGSKELCGYDQERLRQFYNALRENNITVSSIRFGKQEISPANQIPFVDKLWCEFFPTPSGEVISCPLFAHSNNQHINGDMLGCDICTVEGIPESLTCSTVIIAGPKFDKPGVEAKFMIVDEIYNGVVWMKVDWDRNVRTALKLFKEYLTESSTTYIKEVYPNKDWLCITVDYHN